MSESMRSQVLNVLEEAKICPESLGNAGLYLIEVTDDRVKAHLTTLPNFDARCRSLSSAAVIGVLAIGASRPLEATIEVQERFNQLIKEFGGQTESALQALLKEVEGLAPIAREAKHIIELEAAKRKQSYYAGNSFEQRIVNFLEEFARPRQDQVVYSGTITWVDGKVGDIVYRLNLDGEWIRSAQIALEVKNRECARSGKSAYFLDELECGMANRGCEFGIVVACLEKNCDDGRPRFPYLQTHPRNQVIVLVDEDVTLPIALEAALHLISQTAKAKVEAERLEVDVDRIDNAIRRAMDVLEKFRALKMNLSQSITSLQEIRNNVDSMEKDVESALKEAQEEIRKAITREHRG